MVIVLPNRNSLVYHWLYRGSNNIMKIKEIEKKIGTLSNLVGAYLQSIVRLVVS
jgi:hypothetical protein